MIDIRTPFAIPVIQRAYLLRTSTHFPITSTIALLITDLRAGMRNVLLALFNRRKFEPRLHLDRVINTSNVDNARRGLVVSAGRTYVALSGLDAPAGREVAEVSADFVTHVAVAGEAWDAWVTGGGLDALPFAIKG